MVRWLRSWRAHLFTLGILLILGSTPSFAGSVGCPGDCDAGGTVAVDEIMRAVRIGLNEEALELCAAADLDGDGAVTVDEMLAAVGAALAGCPEVATDPGAAPWSVVPRDQVARRCGLDPDLLDAADPVVNRPYAVVRYGRLCHEHYPEGSDSSEEVWSTTKTLGALVTGIAAYQTRDLPRAGRKTGGISDQDRVDHWLDSFSFNRDALIGHVLAMLAHNPDLSYGHRGHLYDLVGAIQINRLSDVIAAAIAQDPDRLGADVEEFTQRFLFGPLGMHDSTWTSGAPTKTFGLSWYSTVRDMARVGLLLLHDGLWSGTRILDADWTYKMTHPSFEDANTGYGYLTWLNAASNYTFGLVPGVTLDGVIDPCAPLALHPSYPHGLSEAPDCNYDPPYACEQLLDAGMWYAAGLGGQFIVGHRGLDLVLAVKNFDDNGPAELWTAIRPALVALDPVYAGDETAFCAAYSAGSYAPDL